MRDWHRKPKPTWLWWSSGKDSAWALHAMRTGNEWDVRGLVGTVNARDGRASMHGVRHALLERQAAAAGLPLHLVEFERNAPMVDYKMAFWSALVEARESGIECVAFGDLFRASLRKRRVALLEGTGLEAAFPLWGRDPLDHARAMIDGGLSAWVCAVETGSLGAEFVGRRYDSEFLSELPPGIDPCGENDEFHTFVEWAPGWADSVAVLPGRKTERYGWHFADMAPVAADAAVSQPADDGPGGIDPFDHYDRLRRVREHVDQHLDEPLDTASVAAVLPMTTHAFGRFFREAVGIPFRDWLTERRLDRAVDLLRDHNDPVSRVASMVGFTTGRTFRRRFHHRFGCTPFEYRQRTRQSESEPVQKNARDGVELCKPSPSIGYDAAARSMNRSTKP